MDERERLARVRVDDQLDAEAFVALGVAVDGDGLAGATDRVDDVADEPDVGQAREEG